MGTHYKSHGMFGKKHSKKTRIKISNKLKGRIPWNKNKIFGRRLTKHHLDLNDKNNLKNNIIYFTHKRHQSFHRAAYHYLVKVLGIKEVKKYYKWFLKSYLK
jgi:hypothetical protein